VPFYLCLSYAVNNIHCDVSDVSYKPTSSYHIYSVVDLAVTLFNYFGSGPVPLVETHFKMYCGCTTCTADRTGP
jgi:hypothetical protein